MSTLRPAGHDDRHRSDAAGGRRAAGLAAGLVAVVAIALLVLVVLVPLAVAQLF